MNTPQVEEIMEWDVRTWSRALPVWKKALTGRSKCHCLEIGANHGGLSLWMASLSEVEKVCCSDLLDSKKKAERLHHRFPHLKEKIYYLDLDILQSSFEQEFDVVIFKSVLGACGRGANPEKKMLVIRNIKKALKPGGLMLFAENMTGHYIHQWMRRKFISWAPDWSYCTVDEWEKWEEEFSEFEIHYGGFLSAFGRKEYQKKILSVADDFLINFIPSGARYMCYGYAIR